MTVSPALPVRSGESDRHLAAQGSGAEIKRGVAGSAISQVAAKVLHLALNVVSTLAVVRYLAPGAYGVYAIVLTVSSLVTLVADFGLPKLAVREIFGASDDDENAIIGTVVVMRIVLALVGIAVVELVLLVLQQPGPAYLAALIASLTGVGEAMLAAVVVVFQVRLVQHWEALVRTAAELLETTAILILVHRHAGLAWLFAPPALATALAAGAAVLLARRRYGRRLRFVRARVRPLLVQALPIAPALLVGVVYHKLDSITLAALRPSRDVGLYSSAAQPIEYAFLTTGLVMNTIFPLMSAAYSRGDYERFAQLYRRGAETLVLVTVAVPLVLLFTARPLARQVFGRAYEGAATPLVLLSFAMVLLTVTVWQSLALLIGGLQTVTLHYNLITLAVAAVLCVALVAAFGTTGAGSAALGTALFVLGASTRAVHKRMGVDLQLLPLLRIVGAGLAAGALLAALLPAALPWPVSALIGVVAFALAARLTGAHRSVTGVFA